MHHCKIKIVRTGNAWLVWNRCESAKQKSTNRQELRFLLSSNFTTDCTCCSHRHLRYRATERASVGRRHTDSSVQCLRWNSIPDWVPRAFFKEVVVVVVAFRGSTRRNQRQRDALRAEIHTDASLRCDQTERQRTSVERGQRSLRATESPFYASHPTSSLYCTASAQNTPIISGSTSGEGGGGGLRVRWSFVRPYICCTGIRACVEGLKGNRSLSMCGQAAFTAVSLSIN